MLRLYLSFLSEICQKKDRHYDQMVQAARSRYQNIAEGSEDSATSKKLEMNLTNVVKSSIGELERDYQKYLMRHNLKIWKKGEPEFEEARKLRPKFLTEAAGWVNILNNQQEERVANLGAILSAQAHWLLERLLDR
ncbi:MAG: four helix bundle protein [Verrucomicrobiota bacterium]|nr:four helix bundle protein [Verrucomicrobiota bacterium]